MRAITIVRCRTQCINDLVGRYVPSERIVVLIVLIAEVVGSFHSTEIGKGLPLGNLTSQLLVNVYMNEFDQFVKHTLKAKYYVRYADDFVILSHNQNWLLEILRYIAVSLRERLRLNLHPDKVSIRTVVSGVDFLGWVHFLDHRVLRTATKRRTLRKVKETDNDAVIDSYLGLLSHGNAWKLRRVLDELVV